ncbi:MAG: hypothetical protein GY948_07835 [Alphaproteobacteria bacterium]|nr:hypothetical protein [Alphaproteobacteria bacterium]
MPAPLQTIGDLIDLERYPLDQPESSGYSTLLAECRRHLSTSGCMVVPGFVRADALDVLVAEADDVAGAAHRSYNDTNVYFSADDESLPKTHPRRRFYRRSNAFVPADNFGAESPLRAIYEWPHFMPFIRDALEEPEDEFFRYGDPLADVIINVVDEGGGFPWHFDTNNFTVTLAIQNGEAGGEFEYCPALRSSSDENVPGVQAVLDGDRGPVRTLELKAGDLQIFRGRYALHRVSAVEGNRTRYVGIFSYADAPGMVARVERTRQLYGKVLPIHLEREKAVRADRLAD